GRRDEGGRVDRSVLAGADRSRPSVGPPRNLDRPPVLGPPPGYGCGEDAVPLWFSRAQPAADRPLRVRGQPPREARLRTGGLQGRREAPPGPVHQRPPRRHDRDGPAGGGTGRGLTGRSRLLAAVPTPLAGSEVRLCGE